jgi:autotransporter-associated beta strand protein
MKTIYKQFQVSLLVTAVLAIPFAASAGTTFTMSVSPTSDNAVQGTPANLMYSNPNGVKVTDTSSYGGGNVALTYNVSSNAAGGSGITVTFAPTSVTPSAPSGGSVYSTLTVSTVAGTLAGTYTVTINGTNTSLKTGSATYTLTVASPGATGPQMVWNGSASTSWSAGANWTPAGPPVSTNDVEFYDAGGAGSAGTVDNIVDANFTVGSLTFGNTNNFHTTQINAGKTLTAIDGIGLVAGTGTANGNLTSVSTIKGSGGTLIVSNASANVTVSQSNPSGAPSTAEATLDLSGLGMFRATVSNLLVGVDSVLKGANGVLNLAATNVITMTPGSASPQIDVGDNSQPSGATGGDLNTLLLGQTNAFYVDSIEVGKSRTTTSTMLFNSAFASPSAYFRGTNTTGRVSTWYVGDGGVGKVTGFVCYGTNDFSLGTVDALVGSMYVGAGSSATGNGGSVSSSAVGNGTLTMNAGNIDVNTLEVGYTVAAVGMGTVNVNGGNLLVNNLLELANGVNTLGPSSGTLNISGGTVTPSGGVIAGGGTSTINLNSGTLNLTNSPATIGTAASALSALNISGGVLNVAVQALTANAFTTNLTTTGTATINIFSVPLLTGFPTEFPLIQYQSASVGGTFNRGTLPAGSPAYAAYLTNDASIGAIAIVFTAGPSTPALTWDGTPSGNWNTSTSNWRPKSGPDTTYADGNFVTFDDSLAGTPNVNLAVTVSPGSVTVSNATATYVFSGAGSLSGSSALVKKGSGTLTLAETGGDNFSGGIVVGGGALILDDTNGNITGGLTINAGTVQIGNNDANGAMPAGAVTDNGALVFNSTAGLNVTNAISGSGSITQSNLNVTTLSGNNLFTGPVMVAQGTLLAGSSNCLTKAASLAVSNNATLDVGGVALFGSGATNLNVVVSGAGVGSNGAIVNSGTSQTKVLHTVTLTGDTSLGGSGDWDIRNSSGSAAIADAQLAGAYNLTKVGTNTITLRGVVIDPGLGNINVQAGELHVTATAAAPQTSLGSSAGTVTAFTNATFTLDTIGTVPSKNFVLTNGGTLKCSGTNTLNGTSSLTLAGAANNTISVDNGGNQFTITTVIGGGGSLSKNGGGTLYLGANNTYSGSTTVSGGTLALYANGSDGSISSTTNINITGGATVDVSGRGDGTFTLAGGQTLNGGIGTNGPGIINGIFIASAGSLIAPGGSGSTNVGTISVISNAVLQGSISLNLNAATGASGGIDAYAITYGGSLVVTNFTGTITNGQTFQLFVATNGIYNAGSFSSIALPAAAGLTWTTNLAVNGSITANVVAVPSPMPVITNIGLLGSNLHLNGTNGAFGGTLYVLASTNLALPLTNWTAISTNTFTGSGTFNVTVTNAINPNTPQSFYIISQPY